MALHLVLEVLLGATNVYFIGSIARHFIDDYGDTPHIAVWTSFFFSFTIFFFGQAVHSGAGVARQLQGQERKSIDSTFPIILAVR
jgi:hypothetical protein